MRGKWQKEDIIRAIWCKEYRLILCFQAGWGIIYIGNISEGEETLDIISGLQSDPLKTLIDILYTIPAILIALTLHELAHGYMAKKCGDPTAEMLGRLSFNPLHHLDPIGTLMMVFFGFGWARPVPVNPRNFKNFKRDELLVSIAGVVLNFLLFLFTTFVILGIHLFLWKPELWEMASQMGENVHLLTHSDFLRFDGWNFYSVYSGENLLFLQEAENGGAYYLGGMEEFLKTPWLMYLQRFFMNFARINLALCLFNLLPIPPLDGYRIFNRILLQGKLHIPEKVMQGVMIAFMIFMFTTDYVGNFLGKAIYFVQGGIMDGLLKIVGMG